MRLSIVRLLEMGMPKEAVCFYTGCHLSTVERWEKRDDICDLPRSGRPLVYAEEQQLKLIGFYCQSQPFPGFGKWSLRMAEIFLKGNAEQVDFTISKSTIHRILQNHNLKPHRSRYFLHISDPNFFSKMQHIIELYLNPPKNLYSLDECPGIQVLQRLVPNLRTEKTKVQLEEFEYIRNGTIDLFACLEVSTGKVFAECKATHDTDTFIDFLEYHILSIGVDEKIDYIMDNLNTHSNYKVCALIAKYSYIECPPDDELNTMEKRRTWLSQKENRITFHYTPFHGSWLNMVEIWFGIIGAKCLKESFSSAGDMYDSINGFVGTWNTLMAHPFKWQYNGDGLHEKTMKRFTQQLQSKNVLQVELRVLTKQLMLMKNLFSDYKDKIPEKDRKDFWEAFQSRKGGLKDEIEKKQGPKRKKKAQNALCDLETILDELYETKEKNVA